jgi:hypothetical protein
MICVRPSESVPHQITALTSLQWLVMSDNLIFMGLHFVIAKCKFSDRVPSATANCNHEQFMRHPY